MRAVEIFVCVWLGAAVVTKATAKDPLEDASASSRSHFHIYRDVPPGHLTTPTAAPPISPTTYRPHLPSAHISPRPILTHHGSPQYLPLPPPRPSTTTTTAPPLPPPSSAEYEPLYVDKTKTSDPWTPVHRSEPDVKETPDYTVSTESPSHHLPSVLTPKPTFKRESHRNPTPNNRPKSHFWLQPPHRPTPVYTLKPVHVPNSTYRPVPVYTPETVYKLVPSYNPAPIYTPRPILKPRPTRKPALSSSVEHGRYEPKYSEGTANYIYSYEVSDSHQGTNFGHSESRQAHRAEGRYYVDLPDSRRMVVTYYADETGYHPTVTFEGEAKYPQHSPGTARSQDSRPAYQGEAIYVQKPLYVRDPPPVYRSVPPAAAASQLLKATLFRPKE